MILSILLDVSLDEAEKIIAAAAAIVAAKVEEQTGPTEETAEAGDGESSVEAVPEAASDADTETAPTFD